MRIHAAVLALGVMAAGVAEASSLFVVAPPPQKLSASLITVEVPTTAPAAGNAEILLSPSMIAKGEPAVADDNVASIDAHQPEVSTPATATQPIMIRGGTVSDGLVTAKPANNGQAETSHTQQEAAQKSEPQSASPPAEAAPSKGPVRQPE